MSQQLSAGETGIITDTVQSEDGNVLPPQCESIHATAPTLGVAFDHVITAQQASAYKPSLAIFQLAQQRIRLAPERWLHVGQSVYHDVVPAMSLGLSTVWVNRPSPRAGIGAVKAASGKPDLEVSSMKALAELAAKENSRLLS